MSREPLMTVKQVADWLSFSSEDACRKYLRRHHVPSLRRGRVILLSPRDVEAVLRGRHHRESAAVARVRPDNLVAERSA